MPHYIGDEDEGAGATVPAVDQNIVTPAAVATGTANPEVTPAEERPVTPEFLTERISELNSLREEQSALYAKMYPESMVSGNNAPSKPPYETMEMYHRQDREYDSKIAGLRVQINQMSVLLNSPDDAKPETKTEAPPATPAPAPELQGPK